MLNDQGWMTGSVIHLHIGDTLPEIKDPDTWPEIDDGFTRITQSNMLKTSFELADNMERANQYPSCLGSDAGEVRIQLSCVYAYISSMSL